MRWTWSPAVLPPSPATLFLHHGCQGHVGWGIRSIQEERVEVGGGLLHRCLWSPSWGRTSRLAHRGDVSVRQR